MARPIALIVAADEPALFFASIEAAQDYLEAIDVRDGVYPVAFSPDGRRYRLTTAKENVLIVAEGGEARPDELRALLVRFLGAVGKEPDANASITDMLAECEPYVTRF